eukprot:scaffold17482_cov52-Attheya_sp.AAC.7
MVDNFLGLKYALRLILVFGSVCPSCANCCDHFALSILASSYSMIDDADTASRGVTFSNKTYYAAAVTKDKRTTPGIPTWSPTVVLTGPEDA